MAYQPWLVTSRMLTLQHRVVKRFGQQRDRNSDQKKGKNMLVVRALHVLKSSGAAFRAFLAENLYDLGYRPSMADPDVWLRPSIKEKDGFKYWEYVL